MLDHVFISVSDFERSIAFYTAALAPLGISDRVDYDGADGPPGSYQDLDSADAFLVIGSNMADCHPILFLRLLDRVKQGAKLIVVDPRRTATADKADLFL